MKKNYYLSVLATVFAMLFITNASAQIVCQASFSSQVDTNHNPNMPGITVDFIDLSTVQPQGGTMTWLWDFGDNNFSQLQKPTHTYQSSGFFWVCLSITYSTGGATCTNVYCDSVLLTSTSGGGGNSWCIDSSQIDSTIACASVYNPVCGCDSVTYDNDCHATYYGGVLSFTNGACGSNSGGNNNCQASYSGSQSLVDSLKYYFSNTTSSWGTTLTYVWSFGDGDTSFLKSPSHTYAQAGGYFVCLSVTDVNTQCTDTYCDSILVGVGSSSNPGNNLPPCYAYFWQYQDSVNINILYLMDLSVGGTTTSYSWDFGDGNTSSQANPTHVYSQLGTYSVCLTITAMDSNNNTTCTAMYCDSVSVDSNLLRSSGFTIQVVPEADPLSLVGEISDLKDISFYPNPVTDQLYIDFKGLGTPDMKLLDMAGKLIIQKSLKYSHNVLDMKGLPEGIYFVQILSETETEVYRIIKK